MPGVRRRRREAEQSQVTLGHVIAFDPAERSVLWGRMTPGRGGGLSGGGFVLPDSLEERF